MNGSVPAHAHLVHARVRKAGEDLRVALFPANVHAPGLGVVQDHDFGTIEYSRIAEASRVMTCTVSPHPRAEAAIRNDIAGEDRSITNF